MLNKFLIIFLLILFYNISIFSTDIDEDNNICHKYDLIYKSLGTLQNNSEIWLKKLDELKEYIDKNDKSIDIYYNNAFDKANINKEWEDTLNERAKLLGASNFNELVINPKYHYYFMGVKLLKLDCEIILRNLRGRPAQLTDLLAINRLLNINIKTTNFNVVNKLDCF